jgi:hypothetical protein
MDARQSIHENCTLQSYIRRSAPLLSKNVKSLPTVFAPPRLKGTWIALHGTDGDVSGVAAWDAARARLAIVLVKFRDHYALRRHVRLQSAELPTVLQGGNLAGVDRRCHAQQRLARSDQSRVGENGCG